MNDDFYFKSNKPDKSIADFVESFWVFENQSNTKKEFISLPDGRIDLLLLKSEFQFFTISILGIGTKPDIVFIEPKCKIFAISFRLGAIEYILKFSISNIINNGKLLPEDFWGFNETDLDDFENFCLKATKIISNLLPLSVKDRTKTLFELIYGTKGEITVKQLSEKLFWNSRQINRYFNSWFGLSLKEYCLILRFRASLEHIANGKFYPELNFADQNHFIRQVKKFSGVIPTELFKHKNDRFVLLTTFLQK